MSNVKFERAYELEIGIGAVYEAWISAETIIPPAFRMRIEPVVGGVYQLEMPGGAIMTGHFNEVVPGRALGYSWQWSGSDEITNVRVLFGEASSGSTVTVIHSGFETRESLDNHAQGWDSYVSGLITYLGD